MMIEGSKPVRNRSLLLSFIAVPCVTSVNLASVGKRDIAAGVAPLGAVLSDIRRHSYLIADIECMAVPPSASQRVWAHEFEIPIRYGAVLILHINIETDVWIHPFELGDHAFTVMTFFFVVLGRKRM